MKKPLALTVTQLMHYRTCPYRARLLYRLGCPAGGETERGDKEKGGGAVPLSAQDLGTVVHRLLELVDFARLEESAAENLKKHYPGLPRASASAALKLAAQWGKSAQFARARAASALYRERAFLLSLDDGTLEGSIDLVFAEKDGSLVVVDYKTSAAHPEYRFQLELYQWAAQKLWENRPVSGGLFLLEEGKFEPVPYPGAAAVAETAAGLAAAWNAGQFDPRPSKEACSRCAVRAICSFRTA